VKGNGRGGGRKGKEGWRREALPQTKIHHWLDLNLWGIFYDVSHIPVARDRVGLQYVNINAVSSFHSRQTVPQLIRFLLRGRREILRHYIPVCSNKDFHVDTLARNRI